MMKKEMMNKYLKKKAVSPLIASVLLIAFVVTLGAIVISWTQTFVEDNAGEAKKEGELQVSCQITTSLGIKQIANSKRICYKNISMGDGVLEFTLENKGSEDIDGVKVIIIGENDTNTVTDLKPFAIIAGGIKKGNISFNFTAFGSTVSQADFIPWVTIDSSTGTQLCKNIKLEESGIYECTT